MDPVKLNLELPLEVFFDFQKREPAGWHYPGCESQFEINSIEIHGVEAGQDLFKVLLERYREEILECCEDGAGGIGPWGGVEQ